MSVLPCLSFIFVANVILAAHARPGNLFLSDSPESIQHGPLVDDFWSLNELASVVPNVDPSPLAQDTRAETDNVNLFTNFSSDIFATDPSDSIIISSACNTEGSLTDDLLQARDEGSCSTMEQPKQQDINLPNLLDDNFLPQGLGTSSTEQTEQSSQGTIDKQPGDPGWGAYGLGIPEALRLEENPELCPPDIFRASITPVCNNPSTGRIEYQFAKLYATMFNIIPHNLICPPQEIWCCSIIRARSFADGERSPTLNLLSNGAQADNLLSLLHPQVAYDGFYCHPMEVTKNTGIPVDPLR